MACDPTRSSEGHKIGHSTFGATCFLLAAKFLGQLPKNVPFKFTSDEFNGINRDSKNVIYLHGRRVSRRRTLSHERRDETREANAEPHECATERAAAVDERLCAAVAV